MNAYTAPELNVERRICGRIRAKVYQDACRFCLHRGDELFGKVACTLVGRTFPLCGSDGRAYRFNPDMTAINALTERSA